MSIVAVFLEPKREREIKGRGTRFTLLARRVTHRGGYEKWAGLMARLVSSSVMVTRVSASRVVSRSHRSGSATLSCIHVRHWRARSMRAMHKVEGKA